MMRFPLPIGDLRWLPRIVGVLVVYEARGRRLPLPRLARLLDGSERPMRRTHGAAEVERLIRLTQGLLLKLYRRDFCYPRALVLFHVLSRWGHPVRLCLGIQRAGARLAGHAWVELDGRPLAEADDPASHYRTTFTYPSTPTRSPHGSDPETRARSAHRPAQAVRAAESRAAREAA